MSDNPPPFLAGDRFATAEPSSGGERRTGGTSSQHVRDDLRCAGVVVGVLLVVGAVLGLIWAWWSPTQPPGIVDTPDSAFTYAESESWVATDGRFLVLTAGVGLVVAIVLWLRARARGPLVLLALIVGGLAGALLTELIGHLTGGGSMSGPVESFTDGSTHRVSMHLPVSLHMPGLVFIEPAIIALVYGLLVAFATEDDLGRPDPVRDSLVATPGVQYSPGSASVGTGDHPQYGWGHGDTPGALQQRDLPPQ